MLAALELLDLINSKGMLASAETIDAIAECLSSHGLPQVVLDPVCSSSVLLLLPIGSNM